MASHLPLKEGIPLLPPRTLPRVSSSPGNEGVSPSWGQATSNAASPPQPSTALPTTPSHLERGAESTRRKDLWDSDVDITSYLEDSLLHP